MSAADNRAIIAALLWDYPTLIRSDVPGARAFAEALGPPPHHQEIEDANAPLFIAAQGVRFEHAGQPREALEQYARLGQIGGWPSLLGGFLVAWSAASDEPAFLDAIAATTQELEIEDDELQARLLVKLATYALDKQRGDLFAELMNKAADTAPFGGSLRRAIRISRANLLGLSLEEEDFKIPPESDPLVDYPWIDDLALGAARAEIKDVLKNRARSPWSWSIRSGRTPLDRILAAERQASWAGALWMRNPIREQVAAQILADPSQDPYRTFFGLAMWVLSGGDDIPQIVDLAEPHFEAGTADALVAYLEAQDAIPRVRDVVLPKVALALWDLLSPDAIDRLLTRMRPKPGPVPIDQEVRHFWGRVSLVVPELWQHHLAGLERAEQAALLGALPPATIDSLPVHLVEELTAAATEAGAELSPPGRAMHLLLQHALGQEVSVRGIPGGERIIAEVAQYDPTALPNAAYLEAEQLLLETRKQEADSALGGSMGFGGRSTAADLALVAQARGAMDELTTRELASEAADDRLPGDFRLDALLALARAASADLIAPELPPIIEPSQRDPFSFFVSVSTDLLKAARLAVLAKRLGPNEQIDLLTLSRHSDVRVRQIACSTAGMFLAQHTSASVEAALLAGLFDPEESVVASALAALENAKLTELSDDAVVQRLSKLYQGYGRNVRAASVRTATRRLQLRDDARLRPIVQSGALDRSWRVRDAVVGEGDAS